MTDSSTTRTVIITGGSSGIGLATAQLFAAKGWRVGLIARGAPALESAKASILDTGATVATAMADVTDTEALRQAAAALAAELGPIDVWINNAGASLFGTFVDVTEAEFRRVTDVVYHGTVNGIRVALEHMRPRDRGQIVNVCSALGLRASPLLSAYSGAKFAMRGFVEALRAELLHERSHVRLGMVYPPSVNTPFYSHAPSRARGLPRPPPPIYQPEVVADAILFAVSSGRRDVLVGGQTVQLALLGSVAPGLADRLLGWFGPYTMTSSNAGIEAARDENLFTASTRPSATHGPFDKESLSSSAQLWATKHRGSLGAGLTLGAALSGLVVLGAGARVGAKVGATVGAVAASSLRGGLVPARPRRT